MLTRTLNKSKVLTQNVIFLRSLVIIRLGIVGVVFGGFSMLANALLLGSYCSVSTGPCLPILPRTDLIILSSIFFFSISEKPVSGLPLFLLEHFYASLHFRTHDLLHCHLERGKSIGSFRVAL